MPLSVLRSAPRVLLGAFFLFTACREEAAVDLPTENSLSAQAPSPAARPEIPPGDPEPSPSEIRPPVPGEEVRFMVYNLKNYLTMERIVKGGARTSNPKAASEIKAVVDIIVAEKPDILGVCEIGTRDDLKDLQTRLNKAGLNLPHSLHTGGTDRTRHLALLSALPISANHSRREVPYQINGSDLLMGRGILDATLELPGGPTRFIGLHLKSKRELEDFDQSEMRLHEARLAREHCEAILASDPAARLVVYGDFNDTRRTPPLSLLMGKFGSETYLGDVLVTDSRGHLWTHFWSYQQQYARLDWVLASPSVLSAVDHEQSYIVDPEIWNEASDHRALLVTLKN